MNWILFRRETDQAYYFWNGEYIICVKAVDGYLIADNIWGRQEYASQDYAVLKQAIEKKRIRVLRFINNKHQYLIVDKG